MATIAYFTGIFTNERAVHVQRTYLYANNVSNKTRRNSFFSTKFDYFEIGGKLGIPDNRYVALVMILIR